MWEVVLIGIAGLVAAVMLSLALLALLVLFKAHR